MSDTIGYPVEEIDRLVVETLARDAVVRGVPDLAAIQVTYLTSDRPGAPEFVPEGRAVRFAQGLAVRVHVPEALNVTVKEALGDLRVQGLAGEVSLEGVRGDLRLDGLAGQALVAQADGDVRADRVADLRILGSCRGDLRFADGGSLTVELVAGDVRLSDAEGAKIGRIHGDLWCEKLSGPLEARQADGDVRLSEVAGLAALNSVSGDLRAGGVSGGLSAPQVNGDVMLSGPFGAAGEYGISAHGDLHVQLSADENLRLVMQAGGRIRADLPLTPAADGTPTYTATVGAGACRMALTARGDLRVSHAGAEGAREVHGRRREGWSESFGDLSELGNLGERIRQQVTASLASAGINLDSGEISLGRGGRGLRGFRAPRPPVPPERPKPPAPPGASSEEQIAILRMVEEGKITPEEADILLRALGV